MGSQSQNFEKTLRFKNICMEFELDGDIGRRPGGNEGREPGQMRENKAKTAK